MAEWVKSLAVALGGLVFLAIVFGSMAYVAISQALEEDF